MINKLRAHAVPRWYSNAITIYFYEKLPKGGMSVVSNLVMTTIQHGQEANPDDVLTISQETAQELMDSLWQCGLRPSEGTGSAGSLKATQDHLKDLQEFSRRLLDMVQANTNRS